MFTLLVETTRGMVEEPSLWQQILNFFYFNWFLIIIITLVITVGAQLKVQATVTKYKKVKIASGLTGAEVAQKILDSEGITDVNISPIKGQLTDNYNPTKKTVFLSEVVYNSDSIVAASIAAHEVGHAIQHNQKYFALNLRQVAFHFVKSTAGFTGMMLIFALMADIEPLVYLGLAGIVFGLIFQLVTLPVEFDASKRAKVKLEKLQLVTGSELKQSSEILTAAALTYVAAMVSTLLYLLRVLAIANRR